MASITSSGIGSGLDVAGLVQQLVAAEARPTQIRIGQLEARAQAKLSAFGSLKSALSSFNDQLANMNTLQSLLARKASSSNEDLLKVVVDETAIPATYSVEVLQLAQAQKLESGSFSGADAIVGTGTLSIAIGAESFAVEIDDDNNTLEGIRDAINNALDNKGVAATIVNGDSGSYLILRGENTGSDQSMIITQSGGDGGLSALEYDPPNSLNSLTETAQALDAQIKVDGYLVTSDNNSVVGAIEGVTLNLVAADVGEITQISVENDLDAVRTQLAAFVDSYNKLIDTTSNLTKFNAEAKTGAALIGDSAIRNVRDQMRRELSIGVTDIAATFDTLNEIGITTDVDGKLSIDDTKLNDALGSEFSKVGQLFAGSDGYAVRLGALADSYLDEDDGIISVRMEGLETTIEGFSDQRETLNVRLESLESRLLKQFNALDALLGRMTATSNFLAIQLQNLPKISISRD